MYACQEMKEWTSRTRTKDPFSPLSFRLPGNDREKKPGENSSTTSLTVQESDKLMFNGLDDKVHQQCLILGRCGSFSFVFPNLDNVKSSQLNPARYHFSHIFTTTDIANKNSQAWPSFSIIFPYPCSEHPLHNRLAQRKTHFLPEAAKILIKTQRSVQQLPRCMSSNGNTWGRQWGRSAACNSLMEGVERRRARGDRGLSQGTKRMRERQRDGEEKRWRKGVEVCAENRQRDGKDAERFKGSGAGKMKEASLPLTHFASLQGLKIALCELLSMNNR